MAKDNLHADGRPTPGILNHIIRGRTAAQHRLNPITVIYAGTACIRHHLLIQFRRSDGWRLHVSEHGPGRTQRLIPLGNIQCFIFKDEDGIPHTDVCYWCTIYNGESEFV